MDRPTAQRVSALMLEYGTKLDVSVTLVMAHGTEGEIKTSILSCGHRI
jgi:hypothetical protein